MAIGVFAVLLIALSYRIDWRGQTSAGKGMRWVYLVLAGAGAALAVLFTLLDRAWNPWLWLATQLAAGARGWGG
ncbi:MAG: hypothetical protein K6T26_04950 [Alicyclobacillus sp.]|nr:hypothetical protein [Alicyclobacillus sp.]